ncbi:MAG: glycosyltransferase [Chloroflexi bacterium]|nr:glycosyltransferase [Chloroflexota bacterium]
MISVHTCPLANLGGKDAGGMNVYVRQLSRALASCNIAVDVFTRQRFAGGPRIVGDGSGVRVIHLDAGPTGPLSKEEIYEHLPEFIKHIEEFRRTEGIYYDRLHGHYWLSGLVTAELRRLWQVPSLVMFHTLARVKNAHLPPEVPPESELRANGEQCAIDGNDIVVVANRRERDDLLAHYRVPLGKVVIVPLGVDIELFAPRDRALARQRINLDSEHLIFSVGRIEPLKGFDTLVRATALLLARRHALRQSLQLWIGGGKIDHDDPASGTEMSHLHQIIESLGLANNVRLLGAIPQEQLPDFYAAADCVVVPSHYESFGLVAVEAMATGTPVIASDVGGLGLSVKDGVTGFLVPTGDESALANRIARVLDDSALRQRLGAAAFAEGAHYSWSRVAERIEAVYEKFGSLSRSGSLVSVATPTYATACGCST